MLKADSALSTQMMHRLFTTIWETATFSVDWMQGILVKVPWDLTECGDWRSITLLYITLKVLCRVILNRIQEKIDATLRWQQAGFRAGRSCVNHITTLRIILEQINEFQDSFLQVFVEFKKAFNRLNQENIWSTLKRRGVPDKLVHFIEARYEAFSCKVLTMGQLNHLDLTDDIVLLSQRRTDMQSKLDNLTNCSKAAGLVVNVANTKSMVVNTDNPLSLTVAGQQVEQVETF